MYDWNKIRRDFPITENFVYFESAGMSPIPRFALDKIISEYHILARCGDLYWEKDLQKYKDLQGIFARILKTTEENVTFLANSSLAISLLAISLQENLKNNFNIVLMRDDFPSTTIPFIHRKIETRFVSPHNGRYKIEDILANIDENTAAVVTSYVQYSTGFRQDLKELGTILKQRNILFIVNATQALPFFYLDVNTMHIDALCCSLHKWGCSGHVGSLFYTSPDFRKKFPPPFAGWLSVTPMENDFIPSAHDYKILDSSDSYQLGTLNFQVLNTLYTSISYLADIGLENIYHRIMDLTDYLITNLNRLNVNIISPMEKKEERSAIISIDLGEKNDKCLEYLKRNDIIIGKRNQLLRISINVFNNHEDIDRLFYFLRRFVHGETHSSQVHWY